MKIHKNNNIISLNDKINIEEELIYTYRPKT